MADVRSEEETPWGGALRKKALLIKNSGIEKKNSCSKKCEHVVSALGARNRGSNCQEAQPVFYVKKVLSRRSGKNRRRRPYTQTRESTELEQTGSYEPERGKDLVREKKEWPPHPTSSARYDGGGSWMQM